MRAKEFQVEPPSGRPISRDDIAALTPEAAARSGIPMVVEADKEEAENILCVS